MTDPGVAAAAPEGAPAAKGGRWIFEAENVVKRFGGIRAVNGATMSVRESSITALIGPNGAGKTTFFNLITGFYKPDQGRTTYMGEPITGFAPYRIARKGMVRTFQITKALEGMPVLDNMMLAAHDQPGEKLRNAIFRPGASRSREREVRKQAEDRLDQGRLAGAVRTDHGDYLPLAHGEVHAPEDVDLRDVPAHQVLHREEGAVALRVVHCESRSPCTVSITVSPR